MCEATERLPWEKSSGRERPVHAVWRTKAARLTFGRGDLGVSLRRGGGGLLACLATLIPRVLHYAEHGPERTKAKTGIASCTKGCKNAQWLEAAASVSAHQYKGRGDNLMYLFLGTRAQGSDLLAQGTFWNQRTVGNPHSCGSFGITGCVMYVWKQSVRGRHEGR